MTRQLTITDRPAAADRQRTRPRRAAGLGCALSGIAGVVIGGITIFAVSHPAAVPSDQWSYPFDVSTQWALGVALAVTHLLTLAGFVGVLAAGPQGRSRAATAGLWAAVVGYAVLAVAEVLSGGIGSVTNDSPSADAVSNVFAVASLLVSVGSIVAGVVIVRRCGWRDVGWSMVLWSGVALVVLVTPANIVGDPVLRMVALMVWSLTFLPLGRALVRAQR